MKTYYIYHIPEFINNDGTLGKIGVSITPKTRVNKQGYFNFEILEEHSNIYTVSTREIELQRLYEYPIDDVLYWKTIENFTNSPGWINSKLQKDQILNRCIKGGLATRKLTQQQVLEIIDLVNSGLSYRKISKSHNISISNISLIINKKIYKEYV